MAAICCPSNTEPRPPTQHPSSTWPVHVRAFSFLLRHFYCQAQSLTHILRIYSLYFFPSFSFVLSFFLSFFSLFFSFFIFFFFFLSLSFFFLFLAFSFFRSLARSCTRTLCFLSITPTPQLRFPKISRKGPLEILLDDAVDAGVQSVSGGAFVRFS